MITAVAMYRLRSEFKLLRVFRGTLDGIEQ
jgi:hypothetical protein